MEGLGLARARSCVKGPWLAGTRMACHRRAVDAAARPWEAVVLEEWLLALGIVQGRRFAVGRVRFVPRGGADVGAVLASAEGK